MLQLNDISLQFAGDLLYKHVDLLFQPDHCYGIIGANGAGKSPCFGSSPASCRPPPAP